MFCIIQEWSPIPLIAHALSEDKKSHSTYDFPQYLACYVNFPILLLARQSVSLHLREFDYLDHCISPIATSMDVRQFARCTPRKPCYGAGHSKRSPATMRSFQRKPCCSAGHSKRSPATMRSFQRKPCCSAGHSTYARTSRSSRIPPHTSCWSRGMKPGGVYRVLKDTDLDLMGWNELDWIGLD